MRTSVGSISSNEKPSLCYITPTFFRDIERFALLRRSLQLFSPDIPHVAYVHSEDCETFHRRFEEGPYFKIIPTSEILPKKIEAARRLRQSRYGKIVERLNWHIGLDTPFFSGWKVQQIVKIEALAASPFDAAVFLDSDLALCGPMTASDYLEGSALRLLETKAVSFEDFAFEVGRQILVGGGLSAPAVAFNYVYPIARFLSRTAVALRRHLEHCNADWHRRLLAEQFPSEYNLLGFSARVLENYAGYYVEKLPPSEWLYAVKEKSEMWQRLEECKRERGRRKFILVQSNLQILDSEYLPRVRDMIERFAEGFADSSSVSQTVL